MARCAIVGWRWVTLAGYDWMPLHALLSVNTRRQGYAAGRCLVLDVSMPQSTSYACALVHHSELVAAPSPASTIVHEQRRTENIPHIPQHNLSIKPRTRQHLRIRIKSHTIDLPKMPLHLSYNRPLTHIPHKDRLVPAARSKLGIIMRYIQSEDLASVACTARFVFLYLFAGTGVPEADGSV